MIRHSPLVVVAGLGGGFLLLMLLAAGPPLGRPRPSKLIAGDPRPSAEVRRAYDLESLTPAEAARLDGKRALFRVTLDSPDDLRGKYTVYDCATPDDNVRTLFLKRGEDADEVMVVEPRLVVLHHEPAVGKNGTRFVGFTEHRLMDALRAGE